MYKLRATILKDFRILTRDKVGLTLMFAMPILLAIVITSIQNGTFKLVNENKVPLLLCNRDTGQASHQLVSAIEKIGMFTVLQVAANETNDEIAARMQSKDALVGIFIPPSFSSRIAGNADLIAAKALNDL